MHSEHKNGSFAASRAGWLFAALVALGSPCIAVYAQATSAPVAQVTHSGPTPSELVRIYQSGYERALFVVAAHDESTSPEGIWTANLKMQFSRPGLNGVLEVDLQFTGPATGACAPCVVTRQAWKPGGLPGTPEWASRYQELANREAPALVNVIGSLGTSIPRVSPNPPTAMAPMGML